MKTLIIAILIAFSFSVIFSANAESVDELHNKAYQFMKSGNFSDAIDTYAGGLLSGLGNFYGKLFHDADHSAHSDPGVE